MKKGFDYAIETAISYLARRKLQAILRKMDEDAKKLRETKEMMNQTEMYQEDLEQPRKAGNARRWQPVRADMTTACWD